MRAKRIFSKQLKVVKIDILQYIIICIKNRTNSLHKQ